MKPIRKYLAEAARPGASIFEEALYLALAKINSGKILTKVVAKLLYDAERAFQARATLELQKSASFIATQFQVSEEQALEDLLKGCSKYEVVNPPYETDPMYLKDPKGTSILIGVHPADNPQVLKPYKFKAQVAAVSTSPQGTPKGVSPSKWQKITNRVVAKIKMVRHYLNALKSAKVAKDKVQEYESTLDDIKKLWNITEHYSVLHHTLLCEAGINPKVLQNVASQEFIYAFSEAHNDLLKALAVLLSLIPEKTSQEISDAQDIVDDLDETQTAIEKDIEDFLRKTGSAE